jgi:RNA 2',3'-cyclic 3'-phosphodiesterase
MNIPAKNDGAGKVRVFFALWPEPALRRQLHALALRYQEPCGGSVMRAETLHLTLLFLGEVSRDNIRKLQRQVDALEMAPFSFHLTRIACWCHNRIAYAAPEGEIAPLQALSQALRALTDTVGVEFDHRDFTPHVTLLRKVTQAFESQSIELPVWKVEAFSLVESSTLDGRASYRALKTWRCTR